MIPFIDHAVLGYYHSNPGTTMKRFFLFFLLFLTSLPVVAQTLITNAYNRTSISLNGQWKYIVDPYENGFYNYRYEAFDRMDNSPKSAYFMDAVVSNRSELLEYNFDEADSIRVPGDWNSQKEKLFYYEGTVWYRKEFALTPEEERRYFMYFGAVNYESQVYLNGEKLGKHVGGFTPFSFEVTDILKEGRNSLVVKVDNKRRKDGVPTLNTDWWNYGGITRDVKLISTPPDYIDDYMIQVDPVDPERIRGFVQLRGRDVGDKVTTLSLPEFGINTQLRSDKNGRADIELRSKDIEYWSPDNPKLYSLSLKFESDQIQDNIGLRSITTKDKEILLNGNSIFLKGISIHEENPLRGGRAYSEDDARLLLGWARELGCNYVRLAHYPHNEHMLRVADELGLMVWSEIPVYWTIDWENPETYSNAENQLSAMINRDKNRASVIIWSMANETPVSPQRNAFMEKLADKARSLDSSRLISAALEQSGYDGLDNTRTISDPYADVVDVLSFNQYIGWYDGLPDKAARINWKIDINKPVLISEFGAGAKFGFHADSLTRWSEEYQAWLYEETLDLVERIPQLSGFSPWILADFRSPRRPLPGIQDGWNRKGLISDRGDKKKAFYVLQQYYLNKK
jgi:beta-glucuronidase